jgi:predicted O-methyltransferase YrrM
MKDNNYKIPHKYERFYAINPKLYNAAYYIREEGLITFLVNLYFGKFFLSGAIKKIRMETYKNNNGLNEWLNYLEKFNYFGIKLWPGQNRFEILSLLRMLKKRNLNTILEIGTAGGGTMFLFSRIASHDATLISIDNNYGWRKTFIKSFATKRQNIILVEMNSHQKQTKNKIKHILKDKKLDFLFIDGDHSYNGVKDDFSMYAGFVKHGGIIVLHDILLEDTVGKFYQEIKNNFKHTEIIDKRVKSSREVKKGIGVLYP